MAGETLEEARRRATEALHSYLANIDTGNPPPEPDARGSRIEIDELISFLTGDDPAASPGMMRAQLGMDEVAATWRQQDIAPQRKLRIGIIGAGQSGLAMARALQIAGVDFVIFERQESVGGVWVSNIYPGCRLDTNNLSYSYSHFQKSDWRHHFTTGGELWEYYQDFAATNDITPRIRFGTEVESATFQEDSATWKLITRNLKGGVPEQESVDVLISAVGVLTTPKVPDFKGRDSFQGRVMHSAEWDSTIELKNKRVAVIGTGASAFQIVPAIAESVKSLAVFQRSGPWMLPTPLYHEEIATEHRELMSLLPGYHKWLRLWDFWITTIGKYELTKADPDWRSSESVSEPNQRFRDALVDHIRKQYPAHPELLEHVVPKYPVGAKRMLRDNGSWARALQQDNVDLVTDGVGHIDERGIHTAKGDYHQVDVIIYSTGFTATDFLGTVDVKGRGGQSLSKYWGDDARAYNTVAIPGFPNLFCIGGPNTGLVAVGSQTIMTECVVRYVDELIRIMVADNLRSLEPSEEALDRFSRWVDEGNLAMAWGAADENSWYRNRSGKVTVSWPFTLETFWNMCQSVNRADWIEESGEGTP
ncbi:4-hydroxyacetophenone monooxygenase [Alcanivorax marinus]|nr:4-hydroxyacetophenone monooxygenase [Alloalcanivorax marinus]